MSSSDRNFSLAESLTGSTGTLVRLLPPTAFAIWLILVFSKATHPIVTEMFQYRREYSLVELGTAFLFLATAIVCLPLIRTKWVSRDRLAAVFFGLMGLAAFVIAMEETQWAQPILGYEIPTWMLQSNRQGEFTFHNMGGLHATTHIFLIVFCVGAGLLRLGRFPLIPQRTWTALRAPAALTPIVLCVLATALLLIGARILAADAHVTASARWTSEIAELYVAAWSFGYVVHKFRAPHPHSGLS